MNNSFNSIDTEGTKLAAEAAENLPKPSGYQVLIAIPQLKDTTEGGIVKPDEMLERERAAAVVGWVVALGPDAYTDRDKFPSGAYCTPGDFILMRSYTGTRFHFRKQEYRLMNDDAVLGTTEHPSEVFKV